MLRQAQALPIGAALITDECISKVEFKERGMTKFICDRRRRIRAGKGYNGSVFRQIAQE